MFIYYYGKNVRAWKDLGGNIVIIGEISFSFSRTGVKKIIFFSRRGLFDLCSNLDHNFGDFEEPPHAKEQRVLSHHDEPVGDAFSVQFVVYRWCPIE